MKCIFCNNEIPDRANFCPSCKNQVKCLKCSEILEKDSEICIVCGEEKRRENNSHNTIEFHETKKARCFKANFSDQVGQSIGEALGIILVNRKGAFINERKSLEAKIDESGAIKDEHTEVTEDVDYTEVSTTQNKNEKVFNIFNEKGGRITLLETRLKALSKRDYGIRLAIIFLYYKLLKGKEKVERNELNSIIKDASLYDGNFRRWIANNNLIGVQDDEIELKAPGRDKAKEYIAEIYDGSKTDKWKLGSPARKRKKKDLNEENNESV